MSETELLKLTEERDDVGNPRAHQCSDCGYLWLHGKDGSHSCSRRLISTLASRDAEIAGLQRDAELQRLSLKQKGDRRWCPDNCPLTGLPFFMFIESPDDDGVMIPTYGGPYDSYTIPERDESGDYIRRRYDHDQGGWLVDEYENIGVHVVDNSKVPCLEDDLAEANAKIVRLNSALAEAGKVIRIVSEHDRDDQPKCDHSSNTGCLNYVQHVAAAWLAKGDDLVAASEKGERT